MKLVLSLASPELDAPVDPRFGRGAYLVIVDTETMQAEGLSNAGVHASGGAGVQAAQMVAERKVEAVISGDFGPNAFNALQAAGIRMYIFGASTTGRQAVERFLAGELEEVGGPTQRGHHG